MFCKLSDKMYFQLDNTPEDVRRKKKVAEATREVEIPRLELAPFTSHPTITFENVPINSVAFRTLQVFNPLSFDKQVMIVKPPPADLCLELSWTETVVMSNDMAILEMRWSPKAPTAQRFTMQMADQKKGRFDVIIVCKTAVDPKQNKGVGKKKISVISKPIGTKKSPKTKWKRSPKTKFYIPCGDKYKNILEVTSSVTEEVTKKYHKSPLKTSGFNNICPQLQHPVQYTSNTSDFRRETYLVNDTEYDKENDYSFQMLSKSNNIKNDFKSFSPTNNIMSAIDNLEFTPMKMTQTYYKKDEIVVEQRHENYQFVLSENSPRLAKCRNQSGNGKKPKNPCFDALIDNIDDFSWNQIMQHVPEDVVTNNCANAVTNNQHCDRTYDENINNVFPAESNLPKPPVFTANLTHSIIDLCDVTMPSKSDEAPQSMDFTGTRLQIVVDPPNSQNKYQCFAETITMNDMSSFTPNTKNNLSEVNLSLEGFNPNRCSTERKDSEHKACKNTSINEKVSRDLLMSFSPCDGLNSTYGKLSSGTYTKGDSPIIPLKPTNQSSPYSICSSPPAEVMCKPPPPNNASLPRKLPFSENCKEYMERVDLKNAIKEKNRMTSVKDIIQANLWQKTPPRPSSPTSLATIPEESTFFEMSTHDPNKKCDTFIINKTFEIPKAVSKPQTADNGNAKWGKTGTNWESKKTTVIHRSFRREDKTDGSDIEKDSEYNYTNVKSVSTTIDPFLASTCLYDERAYDELQTEFKKWLNYLLTPPADLDTNLDDFKMDVGKAWIDSRNKAVPAAPTKEQVSAKYHTSHRLESLRKSAKVLSEKQHIREVFIKVTNQVEKKLLAIRDDRNIHVNIGLQKMILNLLLCYNPLWLRIGLETLYGRNIPLTSNNDIMGLSSFIIEYMFKDPYTNTKHNTNMYSQQYVETIKKFTLKKFLFLVYFLDQAKLNKTIPHDPCLFCRNALYKDSRELLFQFTKEVISGVGDITKHLKPTGYIVSHKQTYLHEFKYAVHNIAVDLKDGVRLTRLMEIILMKDGLTSGLRVPAISRLQKIHNVKEALTALETAGFTIVGDITAKDIADGHREKTLSLLWQLINKFRAPLFCQSALVIQKWWRRKYLRIWVDKRIEFKKNYKYHKAATVVQSWWRGIVSRRMFAIQLGKKNKASVIIQKSWKMSKCRKQYLRYIKSVIIIQRWFRSAMLIKNAKMQLNNMRINRAATKIQQWYRLIKCRRQLASQNTERAQFLQIKQSVITIQSAVRSYLAMKKDRQVYITIRISTIKIQQYYRAVVIKRYVRKQYLQLKTTTLFIQRKFRANLMKNHCQEQYNRIRNATVKIQQFYRSYLLTRQIRNNYIELKSAVVTIQQYYRATCAMKQERSLFLRRKQSVIIIQKYVRGYFQMKIDRRNYLDAKAAIECLRREAAALTIQRKYRAYLQMETDRGNFLILKSSTIKIQRMIKCYLITKSIRQEFLTLKNTAVFIQRKYRAKLAMLRCLKHYEEQKSCALVIQRFYRSYKVMKMECEKYITMKQAAITLQSRYRSLVARREYTKKKNAVILIQSHFRTFIARKQYSELKQSATIIQKYYRNLMLMRKVSSEYQATRLSVIKIQSVFKMNIERRKYLQLRFAVLLVQKLYRKKLESNRQKLLRQTFASIVIQTAWRKYVQYDRYKKLKASVVMCQEVWRSILVMRKQRDEYNELRMATIKLQAAIRGHLLRKSVQIKHNAATRILSAWRMYKARNEYKTLKACSIICQQKWRAILEMRKCRNEFVKTKHSITMLQAVVRGYLVRRNIARQTCAVIRIQTAWRRYIACKKYAALKLYTLILQQKWRSILSMRTQRSTYITMKQASITIQSVYRSYRVRKIISTQRQAVIKIQNAWRTYSQHKRYTMMKVAVVVCQQRWRSILCMRKQRTTYVKTIYAITQLQAIIRGYIVRKSISDQTAAAVKIQSAFRRYFVYKRYQSLLSSVVLIQHRWRALLAMRKARYVYQRQKIAVIKLQAAIRGYLYRRNLAVQVSSAVMIQKTWRRYLTCKYYTEIRKSVIICQQRWRSVIEMRKQREAYEKLKNSTIKLQAMIRGNLARKAVTVMREKCEMLKKKRVENNAAIVIQKHWRGFEVRKKQAEHCRVAALRRRWQQGALESDQLTLAERNQDAMDVLCHFKDVASVIRAFKTLDYVTKVYPMMYGTEDTAVPIISRLVAYMGATNRSVSTLETLQLGAAILLNLTKYTPTAHYVYKVEHVETILTLMLHWCDKDNLLSRLFCTLLWMFGKYEDIRKNLSEYLKLAKPYKILSRVRSGLIRRRRMESRKRSSIHVALPTTPCLSRSFNDSLRLSMTPVKHGKSFTSHLPATEPDYGIERLNQPKLFMDEIQAMDAVFLKFELQLNFVSEN